MTPDNSKTDWLLNDPLGFDEMEADTQEPAEYDDYYTAQDPADFDNKALDAEPMPQATPDQDLRDTAAPQDAMAPQMAEPLEANTPEVAFDGDTSRANPHFKPLLPQPINRGLSGRQLIMDTETTGLDALKGDRIVEVGIIELVDRKFTGEKLHVYINPERGMDEEVIRVHGISEAFLADKPTFGQIAKPLYEFMLGAEIIAHNASFDISFLSMEFDRVGLTGFADQIKITDSLALAKQQYPGQKNTLDALVRRLNVGKMDRTFHGALLDSEILAEVYLAMTGGQVALAIDEDTQSEGAGSHASFAHLADKLVTAKAPLSDHVLWVAKLLKKYPNLSQTQGVSCFYQVTQDTQVPSVLLQKPFVRPTQAQQQGFSRPLVYDVSLADNLYLAVS